MDKHYDKTQEQMNECYSKLNTKITEFIEESRDEDKKMNEKVSDMREDILTIEGAYFRQECRRLLKSNHRIVNTEFNAITAQHAAYNNLGGNHEGDALYEMVKAKYHKHLDDEINAESDEE